MKKLSLLLLFLLSASFLQAQDSQENSINWMTIEEMEAANAKEPRKIIIDVYTDWCGWCKRMDKNTFQNAEIARYINANYYAVKLNAEQKEDIRFRDANFKFIAKGRRGYHELAATLLQGRMSYPSIVYLDENLDMIQPIPGYKDAAQMEQIIKYIGGDHYKTTEYEAFLSEFKSAL
ncbi:MAG: thioredoxin family protein [Owenweeksia sp.]